LDIQLLGRVFAVDPLLLSLELFSSDLPADLAALVFADSLLALRWNFLAHLDH
jgi:hypothetical protein